MPVMVIGNYAFMPNVTINLLKWDPIIDQTQIKHLPQQKVLYFTMEYNICLTFFKFIAGESTILGSLQGLIIY